MNADSLRAERSLGCPSPLALDRFWMAGAPEEHALHAHVAGCAVCTRHLATCEGAARSFEMHVLPALKPARLSSASPGFGERVAAWGRGLTRPWVMAGGLAVIILAVAIGLREVAPDQTREGVAFKGTIGLQVVADRQGSQFVVHEGDALQRGDRLRFRVSTPGPGYVLVVSVEGGGRVTRFYPFAGEDAMAIDGRGTLLGGSIALDAFAGYERVFVVFSPRPFTLRDVRAPAAALAASPTGALRTRVLPVPFEQASLGFRKIPVEVHDGKVPR